MIRVTSTLSWCFMVNLEREYEEVDFPDDDWEPMTLEELISCVVAGAKTYRDKAGESYTLETAVEHAKNVGAAEALESLSEHIAFRELGYF